MTKLSYELKHKNIITENDCERIKKQLYDYENEVKKITNKKQLILCDTKRLLFIAKDIKKLNKILLKYEKSVS